MHLNAGVMPPAPYTAQYRPHTISSPPGAGGPLIHSQELRSSSDAGHIILVTSQIMIEFRTWHLRSPAALMAVGLHVFAFLSATIYNASETSAFNIHMTLNRKAKFINYS